ncbi:peroxisomal N(1)-acetyl-spermine/spermidine oxidase-like [Takifugu flavidus]|uniref:peroxisomal N(1)-acetyl-spermine/spermidine oxidase-like n=1 Tax=Takifugu flavidus TaxID=433684 RepID=UPI0025445D07|nr:peroxisomal N(1)-acetyl-spermine/spermidine oxidase-like [Takifugu flavidus]
MAGVDCQILIIGCGISGVTAAKTLTDAGFNKVRILEATNRSGGRLLTGTLGTDIIDLGAAFIHGPSEENPVFRVARHYGLLSAEALTEENQSADVSERPPMVSNWFSCSGQRLSAKDMRPALIMYSQIMDDTSMCSSEEPQWTSVGHFMRSEAKRRAAEAWKDKDEATRNLLFSALSALFKVECCSNASNSMDDIDLAGFCTYENLKGLDCTIQGGFELVIKNLVSELPPGIVTYNRPVRCVHWNNTESSGSGVTVECEDGERIAADHVILTVPLGYLQKHHSTLFHPPLPPPKFNSIQNLGFGTCNKVFVEFDVPWWGPNCEIIYLVWKDEEDITDHVTDVKQRWIRKMSSFTVQEKSESHAHILCGWIAGREAEYMESLPEEEFKQSVTELIQRFTGNPAIVPKRILRTRWFSDPWTCGSYSYPAVGSSAQDMKSLIEPLPMEESKSQPLQVLFAGEATHTYFYSTVHGALLSGQREANRLIAHYSPKHLDQ